jgi:hypothetical protein
MDNVLAFLAFGRGLRELDQGNYEAAMAQFEESVRLDPGSFASRDAAMVETASLIDASVSDTDGLVEVASTTGEFGIGLIAPPEARTTQDLFPPTRLPTVVTLATATEAVAPSPTAVTLSHTTGQLSETRTSSDTSRDPVQESSGTETVSGPAGAVISIVIPRPGATP